MLDIFLFFIFGDVNILLSVTNRTRRHPPKKSIYRRFDPYNKKVDLMYMYRTPEPRIVEFILFKYTLDIYKKMCWAMK